MENENKESKPTSVVGGIIGAFLGAVIGSIPWAIGMHLGWFVGYLAYLIAFASFFGYKRLNGSRNKTTALVTVVFFSLLLVLAMNFIMIAVFLYSEDYVVDIENIKLYIEYSGADFMKNMAISLGIGIAGVAGINKSVSAYTNA